MVGQPLTLLGIKRASTLSLVCAACAHRVFIAPLSKIAHIYSADLWPNTALWVFCVLDSRLNLDNTESITIILAIIAGLMTFIFYPVICCGVPPQHEATYSSRPIQASALCALGRYS